MNDAKLYYTAPPDSSFEDMKKCALKIWNTYDDPYRTEKVDRIKDIKNVSDNFMYMFAMFDMDNQRRVFSMIHPLTRNDLRERLISGGADDFYLTNFLP